MQTLSSTLVVSMNVPGGSSMIIITFTVFFFIRGCNYKMYRVIKNNDGHAANAKKRKCNIGGRMKHIFMFNCLHTN